MLKGPVTQAWRPVGDKLSTTTGLKKISCKEGTATCDCFGHQQIDAVVHIRGPY